MLLESLNGKWKLKSLGTRKSYEATVPGTIVDTLLQAGVLEDPYYRDNEKAVIPYLSEDYEYRRNFMISGEFMQEDEIDIVFSGIDTVADIYINETQLASTDSMHREYRYAIKDLVRAGDNEIRVVVHSPFKVIDSYEPAKGKEINYVPNGCMKGNQYIRKAHSSFGWDFGPSIPDMGIYKDVKIECYSKARIMDVLIEQRHEKGGVKVVIDPILKLMDNIPLEINVTFGDQQPIMKMLRVPEDGRGRTKKGENEILIKVHGPKYWWPNGLGEQPLYDIHVTVGKADKIFDEKSFKIGLRTLELSQKEDEYGSEFAFVVNGNKMFAMGANVIPLDGIMPRITKEREEELVKACVKANFNCVRIWGGGYYPSDNFYDLCDKYGLVVWQDLMFACNEYELTDEFEKTIVNETKENVKRLRDHACLGLWCCNNEIEAAFEGWKELADESKLIKADYIKIFEYLLPKAIRAVDSNTAIITSSPTSGGCFDNPDDENVGDTHDWRVWHSMAPVTEYSRHYPRFLSEFGFQSFPNIKTCKSFTEEGDRNIFSKIMELHEKDTKANGKMLAVLSDYFLYPKNYEEMIYVSQILQNEIIKYEVEHLRRNFGRCMGALYWQLNDNWPGTTWSSIDYYGRWKALMYGAKAFYNPVLGTLSKVLDEDGRETYEVAIDVINSGSTVIGCKVQMDLRMIDGTSLGGYMEDGTAFADKIVSFPSKDYEKDIAKVGAENVYLEAEFIYTNRYVRHEVLTFVPYKYLNLQEPHVEVTIEDNEKKGCYEITLVSDTFTPFVMLDLFSLDCVFEENVFHLTANVPRTVLLYKNEIKGRGYESCKELKKDLVVKCLQSSYMVGVDDVVIRDEEIVDETETLADTKDDGTDEATEPESELQDLSSEVDEEPYSKLESWDEAGKNSKSDNGKKDDEQVESLWEAKLREKARREGKEYVTNKSTKNESEALKKDEPTGDRLLDDATRFISIIPQDEAVANDEEAVANDEEEEYTGDPTGYFDDEGHYIEAFIDDNGDYFEGYYEDNGDFVEVYREPYIEEEEVSSSEAYADDEADGEEASTAKAADGEADGEEASTAKAADGEADSEEASTAKAADGEADSEEASTVKAADDEADSEEAGSVKSAGSNKHMLNEEEIGYAPGTTVMKLNGRSPDDFINNILDEEKPSGKIQWKGFERKK